MKSALALIFALPFCTGLSHAQNTTNFAHIGHVDRFDTAVNSLIPADAKIEVLCGGFEWAEGPVWVPGPSNSFGGYVLFSDIPNNAVIKWQEGTGSSVFMKPAGYTGVADYGKEPGSNGIALDANGQLVFCEHGDRRISTLTKSGGKMTLADRWNGKRLNSPNDLAIRRNGDIFFTDPIYGLPQRETTQLVKSTFVVSTVCRKVARSRCSRRNCHARTGSPSHQTKNCFTLPTATGRIRSGARFQFRKMAIWERRRRSLTARRKIAFPTAAETA
jgi:hypothetical protein